MVGRYSHRYPVHFLPIRGAGGLELTGWPVGWPAGGWWLGGEQAGLVGPVKRRSRAGSKVCAGGDGNPRASK